MSNFYLTTQKENDKFVCVIYNRNNNTILYRTQGHELQQDAVHEANVYLSNLPQTSVSAKPTPPRRCCGR